MNCTEQFLDDIIEVSFHRRQCYPMAATPNIPNIREAEVTLSMPSVVLSLTPDNSVEDAVYGVLATTPTVKVVSKMVRDGVVYSHDVSCVVETNHDKVRTAISKIANTDTYILYKTASGNHYLTYCCQNTSQLTTEDNAGSNRTITVKAAAKSLSGLISVVLK